MGHGIDVSCRSCGRRKRYILGVGMAYSQFQLLLADLPPGIRLKAEKALQGGAVSSGPSQALYYCKTCHSIKNRLSFAIRKASGKIYRPRYHCNTCETDLKKIRKSEIPSLPCSRCGEAALEINEGSVILWD